MEKFVGYFILGATNEKEAFNEKGLLIWCKSKPSWLVRFLDKYLLKIYWVDKERILEEKLKKINNDNPALEFRRLFLTKEEKKKRENENFTKREEVNNSRRSFKRSENKTES